MLKQSTALILGVFCSLILSGTAATAKQENYVCGQHTVTFPVMIDKDAKTGRFDGPQGAVALKRSKGNVWVDSDTIVQFFLKENPPVLYLGSEQFSCLAEGQVNAATTKTLGTAKATFPAQGQSLGGRLRAGPSTQTDIVASLNEGAPLTILRRDEAALDGYPWFEVETADGVKGFSWGGILCAKTQIKGAYQVCP